ncbi:MAG: hypothetical protein ACW99A_12885 [Candidatus Kariarchaeaceae archaeon]|jgi:hypothetical protein
MKTMINILFVIFFLASCSLFISCDSTTTEVEDQVSNTDFVASETFYFSIAVQNQTMFSIAGINGNITINGVSNTDSVIITGQKSVGSESIADAQASLQNLDVIVRDLANEVAVETDQPEDTGGRNYNVNYQVTLPKDFMISAANVNGIVSIDSINNTVNAANVNGQILLTDIVGSSAVSLVNGQIVAKITLPLNGNIGMANVNGNVVLQIPTNTSAEFSAGLVNGIITIKNLTLQNQVNSNTSVTGRLGNGAGTISLATVNGNINATGF